MDQRRRTCGTAAILAAAILLSACDSSGAAAPGAVSEGEARALDEAAEMLEERNLPEGALPPASDTIEEEPQATE